MRQTLVIAFRLINGNILESIREWILMCLATNCVHRFQVIGDLLVGIDAHLAVDHRFNERAYRGRFEILVVNSPLVDIVVLDITKSEFGLILILVNLDLLSV